MTEKTSLKLKIFSDFSIKKISSYFSTSFLLDFYLTYILLETLRYRSFFYSFYTLVAATIISISKYSSKKLIITRTLLLVLSLFSIYFSFYYHSNSIITFSILYSILTLLFFLLTKKYTILYNLVFLYLTTEGHQILTDNYFISYIHLTTFAHTISSFTTFIALAALFSDIIILHFNKDITSYFKNNKLNNRNAFFFLILLLFIYSQGSYPSHDTLSDLFVLCSTLSFLIITKISYSEGFLIIKTYLLLLGLYLLPKVLIHSSNLNMNLFIIYSLLLLVSILHKRKYILHKTTYILCNIPLIFCMLLGLYDCHSLVFISNTDATCLPHYNTINTICFIFIAILMFLICLCKTPTNSQQTEKTPEE